MKITKLVVLDRDDRSSIVPHASRTCHGLRMMALLCIKRNARHATARISPENRLRRRQASSRMKRRKSSDADLTDMIANGGKEKKAMHAFGNKGVTPDQVKLLVSYIREAQKK